MTDQTALLPGPTTSRIHTLDVLRGVAVLGILAVNAASFALPMAVDLGPRPIFPQTFGSSVAQWVVTVFFEQKFVTLFSMLFGVSIWLVGAERDDPRRGPLLRRRLLWLALFGIIHGAAFWYGDILLLYAWSGMFALLLRSLPARLLILIGAGATLVMATIQAALQGFGLLDTGAAPLTTATVDASIAAYRSGWPAGPIENLKAWGIVQTASLLIYTFVTVPLMMLGMGLFKAGFFHGQMPQRIYVGLMALGAVTLALLALLEWQATVAGQPPAIDWAGAAGSYPLVITLGYASALILLATRGFGRVRRLFAPVGQMAFSNYLTQTLIMTTLFSMPWGPRLMGQVDYPLQWLIVVAVWALQLIWSPLWLRYFRMGPLEWVWRCLTYSRRLPLSREV